MSHKDIARHLHEKYQTSSISKSRVVSVPINIPINVLYDFRNNDGKRGKWLIYGVFLISEVGTSTRIYI